jgi:hypothetical protein
VGSLLYALSIDVFDDVLPPYLGLSLISSDTGLGIFRASKPTGSENFKTNSPLVFAFNIVNFGCLGSLSLEFYFVVAVFKAFFISSV